MTASVWINVLRVLVYCSRDYELLFLSNNVFLLVYLFPQTLHYVISFWIVAFI
jgi:hypothetical protein